MKVIIQKIIIFFYLLNIVILCISEEQKLLEKSGKAYQFYSDPYSNYHVHDYHSNGKLKQPILAGNSNQILKLVSDNEEIIQREEKSITPKPKIKKLIKVVKRIKSPNKTSGKLLKKPVSLENLSTTNSEFHPVPHPVHNPLPPPVFELEPQTPIVPHVVPQSLPQSFTSIPHHQQSGIHVVHHSTPLPIAIQPSTPAFSFQNEIEFPTFSDENFPIVKSLPLRIRSNQTRQLVPLLLPTAVNEIIPDDLDFSGIDLEEIPRFPDVIKKIKPSFLSFEQAPPPITTPKIPEKIQFNFDVNKNNLPSADFPEIDHSNNGGFKPSLIPANIPNNQYQTPEEITPPKVSQNFS